jgi:hypothetical protein
MSKSEKRRARICTSVRLTPREKARIDRAAACRGLGPSAFLRQAALAAARGHASLPGRPGLDLARWTAQIGAAFDAIQDLSPRGGQELPAAELDTILVLLREMHGVVTRAGEGVP